jgi:hypothetical protein
MFVGNLSQDGPFLMSTDWIDWIDRLEAVYDALMCKAESLMGDCRHGARDWPESG